MSKAGRPTVVLRAPPPGGLQAAIDALPPGTRLRLVPREYQGPLTLTAAIELDGQGSTVWARSGPVLSVVGERVVVRNLRVEVTGGLDDPGGTPEEACAVRVEVGRRVKLEHVLVRGAVMGLDGEEGRWRCPSSLHLVRLDHDTEYERLVRVVVPVACRVGSEIAGVEVRPHRLRPGPNELTLVVEPMRDDTFLQGSLVFSTGVTRHIAVSGHVLATDDPLSPPRSLVLWQPPDWDQVLAEASQQDEILGPGELLDHLPGPPPFAYLPEPGPVDTHSTADTFGTDPYPGPESPVYPSRVSDPVAKPKSSKPPKDPSKPRPAAGRPGRKVFKKPMGPRSRLFDDDDATAVVEPYDVTSVATSVASDPVESTPLSVPISTPISGPITIIPPAPASTTPHSTDPKRSRRGRRALLAILVLAAAGAACYTYRDRLESYIEQARRRHDTFRDPDEEPPREPRVDKKPAVPPRVYRTKLGGVEVRRIGLGEFRMGSDESDEPKDKPAHPVKISRPFYIGVTEVTQQQWRLVMPGAPHPSSFDKVGESRVDREKVSDASTDQNPVESVSWFEAVRFCNQLSAAEGLPQYYDIEGDSVTVPNRDGEGYRLPAEAEWEYACRAGSRTIWSFGALEAELADYAWYNKNSGGFTHPVADPTKKPNTWQLFDMHGGVAEWCEDWFGDYRVGPAPVADPHGPDRGEMRVFRGGSWNSFDPLDTGSARRSALPPRTRNNEIGFRIARSLPASTAEAAAP